MKTYFWFVTLLLCFFAATSLAQETPASTEVDGKIEWIFDLAEGQKISNESGKPIFIVFRCER